MATTTKLQTAKLLTVIFVMLTIIIAVGMGLLYTTERQNTLVLQKIISQDHDKISTMSSENASKSAQIQQFLSQPTTTPNIKYVTKKVPQATNELVQDPCNGIAPFWKMNAWNDGTCKAKCANLCQ